MIRFVNRFNLLIFIYILLFVTVSQSWSATYYVDATYGNDNNTGKSDNSPWKTISKINNTTFQPGDLILFHRGETWRETLVIPSSGNHFESIIIGAYGSGNKPVINAANLLSGFSQTSSHSYYKNNISTRPCQVFYNEKRLKERVGLTFQVGQDEWDWNGQSLYLNVGEDPSNGNVEISVRDECVTGSKKCYITIEDMVLKNAKWACILINNSSKYWLIQNVEAKNAYIHGINGYGLTSGNIILRKCELSYNGACGVQIGCRNWKIYQNIVHDNCTLEDSMEHHKFTAGIHAGTSDVENILIEYNHVFHNGRVTNKLINGVGIWLDGDPNDSAHESFKDKQNASIIRYNFVEKNRTGIKCEHCSYVQTYYNVVANSINVGTDYQVGIGIFVARNCHNNLVYNNTLYKNRINMAVRGDWPVKSGNMVGNIVTNNILIEGYDFDLAAAFGGENPGEAKGGYANVYEYNCLGPENRNFIEWGYGTYKSTYASWETSYGSSTHTVEADPLLVEPNNGDFHLQPSSPCVSTGVDVKLTQDFYGNLVPTGSAPDIGAAEYVSPNVSIPFGVLSSFLALLDPALKTGVRNQVDMFNYGLFRKN